MITKQHLIVCDICGSQRLTEESLSVVGKTWVILANGTKCLCPRCTVQVTNIVTMRGHTENKYKLLQDSEPHLREWLRKHAPLSTRSRRLVLPSGKRTY